MTRKDFEAIAAAVKEVVDRPLAQENLEMRVMATAIAGKLADVCAGSNGRFDRGRFLRACGV